jgi:hypothetical protein
MGRFRRQLVGDQSNERSYNIERHPVAAFSKRVQPGLRVCVGAVYERAVDVEDYALEQTYCSVFWIASALSRCA